MLTTPKGEQMHKIPLYLFISFTSLVAKANDKLTIVADLGGESALQYYQTLNIQNDKKQVKPIPLVKVPYDERSVLPIVSQRLTPGKVEPRLINANGLIRPFFLVGDDEYSYQWLQNRGDILRRLKAVGLIVNAQNEAALKKIRNLIPDITLLPVSGDDIADRFKLAHYPVLITATGIEQ